jgi:hypothetical protein
MYGSKTRYLASVFVDAESVTPNAENISGLLNALQDKTFIPMSGQEMSPKGPLLRIVFTTIDGEWQLALLSKRFDLTRVATVQDGSNLGDFSTFCRDAIPKLTTALEYFQRKAHRLGAVQEGFLPDMPKMEMERIVTRLFNFPSIYAEKRPFEWDWRMVSQVERSIGGLRELTNTNTTIRRYSGMLSQKEGEETATELPFDRIRVDFDINTVPTNVIARFEHTHIASFLEQCGSWHENLSSEIFSFILER